MRHFIVSLSVFAVGQSVAWTTANGVNTTARVIRITDGLIEVIIE